MKAIVAVDKEWAIGRNNELLVHLPQDLKHFKELTLGNTVIMGRKTVESLPGGKPLPGRNTIVLTRDRRNVEEIVQKASEMEGDWTLSIFDDILSLVEYVEEAERNGEGEFYVCGGERVYSQLVGCCSQIIVTYIHKVFEDVDSYFPDMDERNDFRLAEESEPMLDNGLIFTYRIYERVNKD